MKLYLESVSGALMDYEAEVVSCVLAKDKINILFKTLEDGDSVERKLSLTPTNDSQSSTGHWIYPITKRVSARFSETQIEQEEGEVLSVIKGRLINFRGVKVAFEGTWTDDAGTYDLYIDAKIT